MTLTDEQIGRLADLNAAHARERTILQGQQARDLDAMAERHRKQSIELARELGLSHDAALIPPPGGTA